MMFEVKLLLIGAVVIGCTLCGRSIAAASGRRARMLIELVKALQMLRIQIVRMLQPLDVALQMTENELFVRMSKHLSGTAGASRAWKAVLEESSKRGGKSDCLHKTELEALTSMFEALGQSSCEGQASLIDSACEIVQRCRDEALNEAAKNGRLYTSIGALTGLSIAIMMV